MVNAPAPPPNPPPSLKLAPFDPLDKIRERQNCNECGRKRMYFCYNCRLYVGDVASLVPRVQLPLEIDIVKHHHELDSKSTAVHAILMAPHRVRFYDNFEDVPNYGGTEPAIGSDSASSSGHTVVLFPSKHSLSISDFVLSHGPIRRLVVLDSTWNTVGQLRSLPQLARLPWVHLRPYRTEYWRPQVRKGGGKGGGGNSQEWGVRDYFSESGNGLSADHLATIEAIYYACREYGEAERKWRKDKKDEKELEEGKREQEEQDEKEEVTDEGEGDAQLDNLLFWFYFFRRMVPADIISGERRRRRRNEKATTEED